MDDDSLVEAYITYVSERGAKSWPEVLRLMENYQALAIKRAAKCAGKQREKILAYTLTAQKIILGLMYFNAATGRKTCAAYRHSNYGLRLRDNREQSLRNAYHYGCLLHSFSVGANSILKMHGEERFLTLSANQKTNDKHLAMATRKIWERMERQYNASKALVRNFRIVGEAATDTIYLINRPNEPTDLGDYSLFAQTLEAISIRFGFDYGDPRLPVRAKRKHKRRCSHHPRRAA